MTQARPSSCSQDLLPSALERRTKRSAFGALAQVSRWVLVALTPWGCATHSAHGHAHNQGEAKIGDSISDRAPQPGEERDEDDPPTTNSTSPNEQAAPVVAVGQEEALPASATPAPVAPEFEVARAELHRIPEASNHLGLVLAFAVRTADLPWVLALENRSPHDITLAALPSLLKLEVIPQAAPQTAESAPPTDQKNQPAPTASPRKVECGDPLPSKLGEQDTVTLPAGSMLVHAFDPSTLCADTSIFTQGTTLQLTYGFPTQTKKLWRKGGFTEQPIEQTAPFLAERLDNGQEPVIGLKHLMSEPLVLGNTYPLSRVTARPPTPASQPDSQAEAPNSGTTHAAPGQEPPPLRVDLQPLGSSEKPEIGLVNVTVTNSSARSVLVHLRREYLSYEVSGPNGSLTCQMLPSALSAGTISYTSIAPGSSVQVATRLAEACPPMTFGTPGRYTVAVRFSPESVGEERNANAYVGNIAGERVVTLHVPGPQPAALPYMTVVPAASP